MEDIQEYKAAVDIPNIINIREGDYDQWTNVQEFYSKEDALKFAQEHFGADEEGRICIISTF